MLTLLAVIVAVASTALEVLEAFDVWLGLVVPFVVAWAVKSTAPVRAKQLVTLGVVVLVTALSLISEDWSQLTAELVLRRALLLAGEAQVTYVAVSAAVARWSGAASMNDVEVFRPEKGIGPATPRPWD